MTAVCYTSIVWWPDIGIFVFNSCAGFKKQACEYKLTERVGGENHSQLSVSPVQTATVCLPPCATAEHSTFRCISVLDNILELCFLCYVLFKLQDTKLW